MALQGIKPFVALYSTFLQRAYDQVVHDVCIQNAPVVLCIDRAGLVGNDGETHHGILDISYLSHIPNMTILSPKDAGELENMLEYAASYWDGPIAIRYPRGNAERMPSSGVFSLEPEHLKIGKKALVIATGKMVKTALLASEAFQGDEIGVVNLRKIKPLDESALMDLIGQYEKIITLEDHAIAGGMGENILCMMGRHGVQKTVKMLGIGDEFVEQGDMDVLHQSLGLDVNGVIGKLKEALNG